MSERGDAPTSQDLSARPPSAAVALAELAFGASAGPQAPTLPTPGAEALLASSADSLDLDLGDPQQSRFGDYTLLAKLGQGGMGVVYRAHQHSLKREVAVKLLAAGPWASPGFIERFRFEAQSAARMQHPNIITIFEAGAQDGLPFFSMRLIRGHSLAERIRQRGPLAPRGAAELMRTVAEAVDYAHRLGVLHLDLKPGNVLLDEQGQPMVADFGLARQIEQASQGESDEVSGTPSYMAPEQATLSQSLSPATDVYALGGTLFEALAARPPFRGATARETLQQVVVSSPPTLRSIDRRLPLDLQAICLRCLDKDPARRYPSARALADDLTRFLEGREVSARPLGLAQRGWRLVRREPRLSALGLLLLLALIGGTMATAVQWRRADANAADALANLWRARSVIAENALAEADGFRGLRQMVANLADMEAEGRSAEALRERQRIGILLANAPRPLDAISLPQGESISSVALSPDGLRVALGLQHSDGGREVRQFDIESGRELWRRDTEELSFGLSPFSGIPHGWLRYSRDGQRLYAGRLQMSPFAGPFTSDVVTLDATSGEPRMPDGTVGDYTDMLLSENGAMALVRYRSDPRQRFPDIIQFHRPDDWEPLGPRLQGKAVDDAVEFHFLPDGSGLLATPDFVRFSLHESVSFRRLWQFRMPDDDPVSAWRFSDDGRWLALGTRSGISYLVESASGNLRVLPSPFSSSVRWAEFDPDGTLLAALAEDGSLMAWRVPDGTPRTSMLSGAGNDLGRVLVRGNSLFSAVAERIRGWSLTPEAPFDIAAVPDSAQIRSRRIRSANSIDVYVPGRLLAAGGSDGVLSFWRLPPPVLTGMQAAPLPVGTLKFDGSRVVSVRDHSVQLRDPFEGRALSPEIAHPQPVRLAELDASGRFLVTVSGRTVRILDPATGRQRSKPILLPNTPLRAEFASGAPVLVLSTGEYVGHTFHERLHVLDLERGQLREGSWRVAGTVERLVVSPHGRRALLLAVTWPVSLRNVQVIELAPPAAPCTSLAAQEGEWPVELTFDRAAHHAWVLTMLEDRMVRLARWDLATCSIAASTELPSSGVTRKLHAAGDGVVLAALAGDNISIVDADAGHREIPALPRFAGMYEMAVTEDGRRAAQASRNAVQLYDLERGERLSAQLTAPIAGNDVIAKLAFSPDASALLGRTYKGHWLLWRLPRATQSVEALNVLAELLDPDVHGTLRPGAAPEALRRLLRTAEAEPRPAQEVRTARIELPEVAQDAIDPRFVPLDLGPLLNVPLNGAWPPQAPMGGDRGTLAPGLQRFNGVDYRIDGGIQLASGQYGTYFHPLHPRSGELRIAPVKTRAVHLVALRHVPHGPNDAPRVQAYLDLMDSRGRRFELPIMHMQHLVSHAMPQALIPADDGGRIAWSGVHSTAVREGNFSSSHTPSHLFAVRLEVPADAAPIVSLSLRVGPGPMEAPLFHAITLEREATDPP